MEPVATGPTLTAPDLIATNASGHLTVAQRRVIGRDFYTEHWRGLAANLGWIAAALLMLRILLPVALDIFPRLLDRQLRGGTPVTVRGMVIVLPLDTILRWFLFIVAAVYLLALINQLQKLVRFLITRHQLLGGGVRSVVGEVRLRGTQPLAIFAGRQVRPWDATALAALAPGTYRFFLLPRFDWLLSAQRLLDGAQPTIEEVELAARYSLTALNGFDREALSENRAGRLTQQQARWLRESAPSIGPGTIVPLGVLSAIGVAIAANAARQIIQVGSLDDHLGTIGGGLLWAAIWGYLLLKQFIDHARQRRDADDGQVQIAEGPVDKWEGWRNTESEGSNTWVYRYEHAGGSAEVSRESFRAARRRPAPPGLLDATEQAARQHRIIGPNAAATLNARRAPIRPPNSSDTRSLDPQARTRGETRGGYTNAMCDLIGGEELVEGEWGEARLLAKQDGESMAEEFAQPAREQVPLVARPDFLGVEALG